MSRRTCTVIAGFALLAGPSASMPQGRPLDLAVEAPPSLTAAADRVRNIDHRQLSAAFARAGLDLPPRVRVTLVPEDDPRARATPRWIVGQARDAHDVVIFPDRVGSYPYGSLESVVWHEVAHLALSAQAGGRALPRWFHEGVAMSVERGWGLSGQARLLLATVEDPNLADLGRLFASDARRETATAYLLAAALVSDVRQRHGADAPGAIVDRVARGLPFARAFEVETGVTPDQAAARTWGVYRRWTSWIPVVTSGSTVWMAIMALSLVAFVATLRRRAALRRRWDQEEAE
jgi:hypothetical protein